MSGGGARENGKRGISSSTVRNAVMRKLGLHVNQIMFMLECRFMNMNLMFVFKKKTFLLVTRASANEDVTRLKAEQ